MIERGCPQCGSKDKVGIEVDSWDNKLRVSPWYFSPDYTLEPCICLNCGCVYIDQSTLAIIRERIATHEKRK